MESKCSLVMTFGQFMQYYKKCFFIKKFYVKCGLEISSTLFLIFTESFAKRFCGGQQADFDKFW